MEGLVMKKQRIVGLAIANSLSLFRQPLNVVHGLTGGFQDVGEGLLVVKKINPSLLAGICHLLGRHVFVVRHASGAR